MGRRKPQRKREQEIRLKLLEHELLERRVRLGLSVVLSITTTVCAVTGTQWQVTSVAALGAALSTLGGHLHH